VRDVLPRPLSAAPAPSRVLGRAPRTHWAGVARLDLGGARFRSASRRPLAGPASFLDFCPRRIRWRVASESSARLRRPSDLRPYERSPRGRRSSPERRAPLGAIPHPPGATGFHRRCTERRLRSPVRAACAVRRSRQSSSCRCRTRIAPRSTRGNLTDPPGVASAFCPKTYGSRFPHSWRALSGLQRISTKLKTVLQYGRSSPKFFPSVAKLFVPPADDRNARETGHSRVFSK